MAQPHRHVNGAGLKGAGIVGDRINGAGVHGRAPAIAGAAPVPVPLPFPGRVPGAGLHNPEGELRPDMVYSGLRKRGIIGTQLPCRSSGQTGVGT